MNNKTPNLKPCNCKCCKNPKQYFPTFIQIEECPMENWNHWTFKAIQATAIAAYSKQFKKNQVYYLQYKSQLIQARDALKNRKKQHLLKKS